MVERAEEIGGAAEFEKDEGGVGDAFGDLHPLSTDVVNLLHEQAFAPGEGPSEADICKSFSDILQRHWHICCIINYLRDEGGRFRQSAVFTHPHVSREQAQRIGALMVATVERTGVEYHVWTNGATPDSSDAAPPELLELFRQSQLKAGVAVPIYAHRQLAGAFVVVSEAPEELRVALRGVRFVGPAVIIAIGYARRDAAMNAQRRRIESLVAELQQRTAALEEANRELQRIGRYRSLFLARMSHELRTPLTSILGFAEILLEQEDLTATQRRFCEKIQGSGVQLKTSLSHLLDLSRLEAGRTELFLHEFSLREMLRESCTAVARLAKKQDVTLECLPAQEIGAIVSDEGKLRQVLYNFLAHAIGRSPLGGRVVVSAAPEEGNRVSIEITDQGEPLSDPASLFDPVDIDAPSESGTNMNELGLVIAHRLLEVLGGRVTLHDLQPAGLAVRLTLPARPKDR